MFLKPVSGVVFGVTLTLYLIVGSLYIDIPALWHISDWQYFSTHPTAVKCITAFGGFALFLYWSLMRWYQKKCVLVLDKDRRTYRTIDTATMNLKMRTGSWNDIAGICVQKRRTKGNGIYYVRLRWNRPFNLIYSLGGFSKPEKAEAFAEKMSKELGLPLVAAPLSRN